MADEATPASHGETASTESSPSYSPPGSGAYILRTLSLDSLSNFWSLPRELQQRIIFLSCQEPCLDRRTIVGRCIDHTTTMLGLIKACRLFYIWVLPLLYRNVRLPRPSVLVQFQRTLADHPGLSQLVRRIHVGADEILSQDWFPMRTCDCGRDSHLTFRLNEEKPEGEWDYSFHELGMEHVDEGEDDESIIALAAALKYASEALDVSLRRQNFSHDRQEIGSDAWHVRVLEVQAAVELYSLEIKRVASRTQEDAMEKELNCNTQTTSQTSAARYPRLLVDVGTASGPSGSHAGRADIFRVTRSQILARLTSPGSMTDFFNHPILFARTGLPWYAKGPDDEEHEGGVEDSEIGGVDHIPDVLAPSALGHVSAISAECWDFQPLPGSSTTTVGGNIVLARSVLSMVPNLLSISLTGIFDRILTGGQPLSYKWLRKATIGPPPSLDWYAPLETSHSALDSIEQLRICDTCLLESNVAELTGNSAALPRLKKLQWSISSEYWAGNPQKILDLVFKLIGFNPSSAAGQSRKRSREDFEDENEEGPKSVAHAKEEKSQRAAVDVELFLHPKDVKSIFKAAPNEEVAEAWRKGEAVTGMFHRLKLAAQTKCNASDQREDAEDEAARELYSQGRGWWERG